MSKAHTEDPTEGKLGPLIERLGPLNNRWRTGAPAEKVVALWEMGDALTKAVPEASDSLLWELQKRSYITRNVLRYALIIRRSWESREELRQLAQGLRNYTVFREALPFLKGDREGIDDATYERVVSLLDWTDTRKAIRAIKELKAQKIGRQHKKGSGAAAARDLAAVFRESLKRLEAEAASGVKPAGDADDSALVALSRAAMNVASGAEVEKLPALTLNDEAMRALSVPLSEAARGGRASASAFRKAVGADALMRAADLLNSMRSEGALAEWRRRHRASFSI